MRIAPCCVDGLGWPQGVLSHSSARTHRKHGRPMDGLADGSVVGRVICGLAAGRLPARRCGTRRKAGAADGRPCRWISCRAGDLRPGCRALARQPSRDTPQVRPCRLWCGIHAAQGPATVGGQGPVKRVGVHGCELGHDLHCLDHVAPENTHCSSSDRQALNKHPTTFSQRPTAGLATSRFHLTTDQRLVRCPRRLRDRVAAWMPPPNLHGRTCGVSRER
ncbi:hypothetical protein CPBF426_07950 [Xanthomonas arboricola pv. juglandis]|nr:hypothetical protein CPBF426_07950 [Xanthomonas arboricola pv. juglandis]